MLSAYWIKCQLGIDTVKSFKLEHHLPVDALQKRQAIVHAAESGELWRESFDSMALVDPWSALWAREEGAVVVDQVAGSFDGSSYLKVESQSAADWAYQRSELIQVSPGDVFKLSLMARISPGVHAAPNLILYDADQKLTRWNYGYSVISASDSWQAVTRTFIVPRGTAFVRFRFSGSGKGIAAFDEIHFSRQLEPSLLAQASDFKVESARVELAYAAGRNTLIFKDKSTGSAYDAPLAESHVLLDATPVSAAELTATLTDIHSAQSYRVSLAVDPHSPEVVITTSADPHRAFEGLNFPPALLINHSSALVLPVGEGFLLPKAEVAQVLRRLSYGGGWPMAFIGALSGKSGWMQIVETPVDFELALNAEGALENRWISQKGAFGYDRVVRYVLVESGGYAAMAKRYRQHAKEKGFLVTLEEKNAARHGNLSRLAGAVNVWFWGGRDRDFIDQLKGSGVGKVLYSNAKKRTDVMRANESGYLSSVYDIYQDVWPPELSEITAVNEGWPDDLVLDAAGEPIKGWAIQHYGAEYPGGVVCSVPALERARARMTDSLKGAQYTCRFIDTTTSTRWKECYNAAHPTTRAEDMEYRIGLLGVVSKEMGLVSGSEDGVDAAVPNTDYFEGMLSPGFARLPGSGRNVAAVTYVKPTEIFLKYQVGEKYRIPLWRLAFGDCAVSTWYWDDSNNRIPETWHRKDLFNILYGNMPLWAIRDWAHWDKHKSRFIESYKNVGPVFEKVAFSEMMTHDFLTEDHSVQRTTFSNQVSIYVNFGAQPYQIPNTSHTVLPSGYIVFDGDKVWQSGQATIPSN